MINFLDSEQDYNNVTNDLKQIFREGIDIVENAFVKDFTIYTAFEFDKIYSKKFYSGLKNFLDKLSSKGFIFYTLVPTSNDYFFKHFSKYSIARVAINAPYNDYMEFLHRDPGNSPADALLHNAETIAIFSNELIWGIIGSKDLEVGIVSFKDEKTKNDFISCFDEETFIDVNTRLNDLDEMLKLTPETKVIHSQIATNYSNLYKH